ncbi:tripartite tricarboxylate transporter TctB family protein [Neomoorella mulderi]|uniref:Tripartite tricarboxylate transporter TctB family protein n=1 Tax=Moorella mulderi DSM 14980 TaxID=1122241 RepID=A0A151ATV9_9FIRM|nr:tripartite tricarboxylate transporter TctB family protein [Moorella mulderi]KYH31033.1 tripartite tricarboxylate transporter TctB family protein [Moorella mulderi DSM 14980]
MGRKSEFIFTLGVTGWGLLIAFMSYQLGIGSLQQPGGGLFPLLAGSLIFAFGALLLVDYLKTGFVRTSSEMMFEEGGVQRFIGTLVSLVAWLVFMPWLGYIIVTFLVALALFKVMGLEGWLRPILLSLSVVLFFYVLFEVCFYIDLPRGILG